jgi:hypothetical protein
MADRWHVPGTEKTAGWLSKQRAPAGILYPDIAALINDACSYGIIAGGPARWELVADCVTDSDGAPCGWRILVQSRGMPLWLASDVLDTGEDTPDPAGLIAEAADEATRLYATYRRWTG